MELTTLPLSPTRLPGGLCPADTWIVIAAFNERGGIERVLDDLSFLGAQIVVVDDGSEDGTAATVLCRPAWLVRHSVNLGQGAALQTGIAFALSRDARYIVTFDADGQHRADDVPALLAALSTDGADFALGSRFLGSAEGIPATRRLVLRLAILFTRLISGVRLSDAHNGLRALSRRGAEAIGIRSNRMEHASELIDQIKRSGLTYVEVPVLVRYTPDRLGKGQRSSDAIGLGLRLLLDRLVR